MLKNVGLVIGLQRRHSAKEPPVGELRAAAALFASCHPPFSSTFAIDQSDLLLIVPLLISTGVNSIFFILAPWPALSPSPSLLGPSLWAC